MKKYIFVILLIVLSLNVYGTTYTLLDGSLENGHLGGGEDFEIIFNPTYDMTLGNISFDMFDDKYTNCYSPYTDASTLYVWNNYPFRPNSSNYATPSYWTQLYTGQQGVSSFNNTNNRYGLQHGCNSGSLARHPIKMYFDNQVLIYGGEYYRLTFSTDAAGDRDSVLNAISTNTSQVVPYNSLSAFKMINASIVATGNFFDANTNASVYPIAGSGGVFMSAPQQLATVITGTPIRACSGYFCQFDYYDATITDNQCGISSDDADATINLLRNDQNGASCSDFTARGVFGMFVLIFGVLGAIAWMKPSPSIYAFIGMLTMYLSSFLCMIPPYLPLGLTLLGALIIAWKLINYNNQ